jgi:carboxypeptidase T
MPITTKSSRFMDYSTLVELVDMGDSWDKVTAGGPAGYDLQGMVVTNENIAGPKPRFFLMGAIHAREYRGELRARDAGGAVVETGKDMHDLVTVKVQ